MMCLACANNALGRSNHRNCGNDWAIRRRPHGNRQRTHTDLGLVNTAGVATLSNSCQFRLQHARYDDRVSSATRQTGGKSCFENARHERGEYLPRARTMRRPATRVVSRVPQRPNALDSLNVDNIATDWNADLNGFTQNGSQINKQRQGMLANR